MNVMPISRAVRAAIGSAGDEYPCQPAICVTLNGRALVDTMFNVADPNWSTARLTRNTMRWRKRRKYAVTPIVTRPSRTNPHVEPIAFTPRASEFSHPVRRATIGRISAASNRSSGPGER